MINAAAATASPSQPVIRDAPRVRVSSTVSSVSLRVSSAVSRETTLSRKRAFARFSSNHSVTNHSSILDREGQSQKVWGGEYPHRRRAVSHYCSVWTRV